MPNAEPNEQERKWDALEQSVVYLLTDPESYPAIWSVPDIGREIDYFDPEAVVYRLHNARLVYKTSDGFVFASPAAWRMVQMVGHVI
jgi:hypothetical protein